MSKIEAGDCVNLKLELGLSYEGDDVLELDAETGQRLAQDMLGYLRERIEAVTGTHRSSWSEPGVMEVIVRNPKQRYRMVESCGSCGREPDDDLE